MLSHKELEMELNLITGLTPILTYWEPGSRTSWRFEELPRPLGFFLEAKVELGVCRVTLKLDNLAAGLVASLNEFCSQNWEMVQGTLDAVDPSESHLQVLNKGKEVRSGDQVFDGSFEIHGKSVLDDPIQALRELLTLIVSIFGFMAGKALDFEESEFREEGAVTYTTSRRYERSRFNRRIAIQIHGTSCFGCDFSFQNFYGDVGIDVIEVHHLLPVHLMEQSRVVDPRTELVPLCSNCHTLVHRIDPPYTLSDLRKFVDQNHRSFDR
jgi:5-methylcytosine-specific restriction protein A